MKKDDKQAPVIQNEQNPTKPSREEIRTQTPRTNAPRQSDRPVERSRQKRVH